MTNDEMVSHDFSNVRDKKTNHCRNWCAYFDKWFLVSLFKGTGRRSVFFLFLYLVPDFYVMLLHYSVTLLPVCFQQVCEILSES